MISHNQYKVNGFYTGWGLVCRAKMTKNDLFWKSSQLLLVISKDILDSWFCYEIVKKTRVEPGILVFGFTLFELLYAEIMLLLL